MKTPRGNDAYVYYSFDGIPTDGLIPLYLGYTIKNKIYIQPHLIDDKGLLQHELTHVDQYDEYCFWSKRYQYNKSFRLKMESEAFATQLKGDGCLNKLNKYANELSTKYNIDKTQKECEDIIMKFYKEIKDV